MITPRGTIVVPEKYLPFLGAAAAAVVTLAYILWGPDNGRGFRAAAGTSKRRRVAGLENLGNTCYLNTILQSLAACPLFVNWLSRALRQGFFKGKRNELAYKLSKTIEVVNDHSANHDGYQVYSPHEVLHALYNCSWKADKDQQDAHELFQFLLSILGEDKEPSPSPVPLCDASRLTEPRRNGLTTSHNDLHSNIDASLPKVALRDSESPFRGLLANHLTCTVCGHRNPVTYSSFDCLTLPIPATLFGTLSLECILDKFTIPELVHDVECTECSREIAGKAAPPRRKSARKLSPPSTKKICPPTPKKVRSPTAVSMRAPPIFQGTKTSMFVTPPTFTETLPTLLETLPTLEAPPTTKIPITSPMKSFETPPTSPETPPTTPEAPPTSPETPPTSPETPPTSSETPPTSSSETPPTSPEAPPTLPVAPATSPEAPPTSPEAPPTLPVAPATSPETPPTSPETPSSLPETLPTAPAAPPTAPAAPPTAPETPTLQETPPTSPETPPTVPLTKSPNNQSDVISHMRTLPSAQSTCEFMTNGSNQPQQKEHHVRELATEPTKQDRANSASFCNGNSAATFYQSADSVNLVDNFDKPKARETEDIYKSSSRMNRANEHLGLGRNSSHTVNNSIDCSALNGEPVKMEMFEPNCEDGAVDTKTDCPNLSITESDSLPYVKQSDKIERVTDRVNCVMNDGAQATEFRQVPLANNARPSVLKPCLSPSLTDVRSLRDGMPAKSIFGRIPGADGMPLALPEAADHQSKDNVKSLESSPKCRTTFRKQLTLGKLPHCLCIHLQRVTWMPNGLPSRREEHVMFPEYLDLSPYKQTTAVGSFPGRDTRLSRSASDTSSEGTMSIEIHRRKSGQGFIGGSFLPDNAALSLVGGSLSQLSPRISHHASPGADDRANGAPSGGQNGKDSLVSEASGSSKHVEARYRLASAVVHQGDAFSGHFMTFRRAPSDGNEPLSDNWLCISDESVYTMTAKEVFSQKAYMLYYQRV